MYVTQDLPRMLMFLFCNINMYALKFITSTTCISNSDFVYFQKCDFWTTIAAPQIKRKDKILNKQTIEKINKEAN